MAAITGYDSIPENAKIAVDSGRQDTTIEQNMVNTINNLFEKYLPGGVNNPPPKGELTPLTGTADVDTNGLATKDTLIKPDANDNLQIVIPEGFAPAILAGSGTTTSLPGQDGRVASIMPASDWKNITTEQINNGIVIVDHAITYDNGQTTGTVPDFNEYVWVPIPTLEDFDRESWSTPGGYANEGYWTESDSGVTHLLAETKTNARFWDDKTSTEYINMENSVNTYKGFFVARYEAAANETSTIAWSKRGGPTWTGITAEQAIQYSANNTAHANMHLLYGVEWDSMLNWLIGNATILSSTSSTATKTMTRADVETDSTTWGNHVVVFYQIPSKQNTGSSEKWKANNIYDIAGNVWEWTQEGYSTGTGKTYRGGNHFSYGDSEPSAQRIVGDPTLTNGSGGFRYGFFL